MNQINESYFPAKFINNYVEDTDGGQRFLTYTLFRFLSAAAQKHPELISLLPQKLSLSYAPVDFAKVEDFLSKDYYFSPSLAIGSADARLLYDSIYVVYTAGSKGFSVVDDILIQYYPTIAALSFADITLPLGDLLYDCATFYGALYLAFTHERKSFADILPRFAPAYREELYFTYEDFLLFDFMDEYFEEENCRKHPSFIEMTDTLVAATLNYHNTDFGTILEQEIAGNLNGTSARTAALKRYGSVILPAPADRDRACHMLAELFRYSALYELRNNLFDFHLDDDKLITLENWKTDLHWHYVQYANVFESAIASYYAATLSHELAYRDFLHIIQ